MTNSFQGSQKTDAKYAIVVSRFNFAVTSKLLDGAVETLEEAGVPSQNIDVAWVPGAWEIPLVTGILCRRSYAAIICLGAVIKGGTTHDEHINRQVSTSLGQLALRNQIPILFGVLTCQSTQQAIDRAGGTQGNKGVDCARAALEMASLMDQLRDR